MLNLTEINVKLWHIQCKRKADSQEGAHMPTASRIQVLHIKFKLWSTVQCSFMNLWSLWSWSEFVRSKCEWPDDLVWVRDHLNSLNYHFEFSGLAGRSQRASTACHGANSADITAVVTQLCKRSFKLFKRIFIWAFCLRMLKEKAGKSCPLCNIAR